jgi:hypothetical protein
MSKITVLAQVSESPLCWPEDKPRTSDRRKSAFVSPSMAKSFAAIVAEIRLWKGLDYVISQDPQYKHQGIDPGIAVWWTMPAAKAGAYELRVLACDTYNSRAENAWAIALTLKNLRSITRYGAYSAEQAAESMRALPAPGGHTVVGATPWWEVLKVERAWPIEAIERTYKLDMREKNRDGGLDADELKRMNVALAEARAEKG